MRNATTALPQFRKWQGRFVYNNALGATDHAAETAAQTLILHGRVAISACASYQELRDRIGGSTIHIDDSARRADSAETIVFELPDDLSGALEPQPEAANTIPDSRPGNGGEGVGGQTDDGLDDLFAEVFNGGDDGGPAADAVGGDAEAAASQNDTDPAPAATAGVASSQNGTAEAPAAAAGAAASQNGTAEAPAATADVAASQNGNDQAPAPQDDSNGAPAPKAKARGRGKAKAKAKATAAPEAAMAGGETRAAGVAKAKAKATGKAKAKAKAKAASGVQQQLQFPAANAERLGMQPAAHMWPAASAAANPPATGGAVPPVDDAASVGGAAQAPDAPGVAPVATASASGAAPADQARRSSSGPNASLPQPLEAPGFMPLENDLRCDVCQLPTTFKQMRLVGPHSSKKMQCTGCLHLASISSK